jgi:tetratricopeptide (TPR) repeat protein
MKGCLDMKEKLMTLLLFAGGVVIGSSACAAGATLQAHWKLDETIGTTALDSSGNGYHATLIGGLSFDKSSAGGVEGRALNLDGSNDGLVTPDSFCRGSDSFTIALWFNPKAPLDSDSNQANLLCASSKQWYHLLVFNKLGSGEIGFYVDDKTTDGVVYVISKANSWGANTWYHIAITFEGGNLKLYVDGQLEQSVKHLRDSIGSIPKDYLGIGRNGEHAFEGKLDDFRIYGGALSESEVSQLCQPVSSRLAKAVQRSQKILEARSGAKGISLVQKEISQCEAWKNDDPNSFGVPAREMLLDMYYILAEAKKAANLPKKEVDAAYRRSIEPGFLPAFNGGAALFWLHENTRPSEYEKIIWSLIENNSNYLNKVVAKAKMIAASGNLETSVRFIEDNLAACTHWRKKHLSGNTVALDSLPEVYFQLGRAKESLRSPLKEIACAYSKTFVTSNIVYIPIQTEALAWLLDNECAEECKMVMSYLPEIPDFNDPLVQAFSNVCKNCELKKNGASFERFLNSVFGEKKLAFKWARFIESCLQDTNSQWAKRYYAYMDNHPRIVLDRDETAVQRYMTEEKYAEAAELYRNILTRGGAGIDKAHVEFLLCKCMFLAGEYRQVIPMLERFTMKKNEKSDEGRISEAMLMKIRAHAGLEELDKAIQICSVMLKDNSEASDKSEVGCLLGYYHMMKGDLDKAKDVLVLVVRDYPESSSACKAQLCLSRLETTTN